MNSDDARIEWVDERERETAVTLTCERCGVRGAHELSEYSSGTWARCLSCLNWWRMAPPAKFTYGKYHG